jgi:hypothetical protein
MDPALRALLDHSRFHQGAVQEVVAALPESDAEVGAMLAETIAAGDQLGFLLLATAAVEAGRRLEAELLVGGTALMPNAFWLGCLAWKMEGDVAGTMLAALSRQTLPRERHAETLAVIAAWCAERRDGGFPAGFAAEARRFAGCQSRARGS